MSEREVFSASEIEAYLQCPYRWYIERLVRPRELDERIDSAAAGRVAHDIMCRFYEEFITRAGHRRVTPETLDAARAIHEDVAATALQGVRETTASEAAAIRATSRRTTYLVEADATLLPGFEPSHREWSFGLAEGDMPEPLGGFSLVGRVDRIDTDASRLVVTDYKLGAVDSRRGVGGFETEGLVQLPLYAVVASRRLGLAVAGGLYRSVRDSKPRGFVREDVASGAFVSTDFVEAKAIDACIDSAIERATESVGRMRAGDIRAEPRSGVCPSYCFARAFCAEWSGGNARA
jgi:ATP-dependent helicase/DNAse subunit B